MNCFRVIWDIDLNISSYLHCMKLKKRHFIALYQVLVHPEWQKSKCNYCFNFGKRLKC